MPSISIIAVLKAATENDLEQLDRDNKTILVDGVRCSPKYLMYLIECFTGISYKQIKASK